MKTMLVLFAALFFIAGCNNSGNNTSTDQKKDSALVKDSSQNPKYNPASPPAENSQ